MIQQLGAKNKRIDELQASLSAVTAERDRLREEATELDGLRDKLSGLLRQVAIELRGPEPELTRYGYADIPLRVKTVIDERDQLRAEVEALRKDAERYRWLRMADWWRSPLCVIRNPKEQAKPGSDCPSRTRLDEAVDAALAAKEG